MTRRLLTHLLLFLVFAISASAQISASLRVVKREHFIGEPVLAVVTVTNHAGRDLVFQSNGRMPWLSFTITKSNGEELPLRNSKMFGPMKITPGQTLGREVEISSLFELSEPGTYTVMATIQQPGTNLMGTATNRAYFNQTSARPYWTQRVGIPGKSNQVREYRVFRTSNESVPVVYAQVLDATTGRNVRTFLLGSELTMRKPVVTVDRSQRLHVMFLATPSMWLHSVVDTDGRLVVQQLHQRPPQGDPLLLTMQDGSVRVANSIPYDPKAAAELRAKTRKASDRPKIDP
jgi:hypothetical protein